MTMSFAGLNACEERLGMATGRPFVAYLVLLFSAEYHSWRHGSEALAPMVQPFEIRQHGTS